MLILYYHINYVLNNGIFFGVNCDNTI